MASFIGRRLITIVIFIVHGHLLNAQFKQIFIKDKQTKEPLAYATVLLIKESKVCYSDSIGTLFLEEKLIQQNDSLEISFINYKKLLVTGSMLAASNQILLERSFFQLREVIVSDCKEEEIIRITDKYGTIQSSNGAGFDIPIKLLGFYPNETGKEGWLSSIEFYASSVKQPDAKLRIHWYEWDELKKEPGKDITDTNIIVAVHKNGWNKIDIPEKRIFVGSKGIVLGFDMIYPSTIFKAYKEIKDDIEARQFRFKYNWFLGSSVTDEKEGFDLFKDIQILPSRYLKEKRYHKPAIHLYIKTCSN
ncbi:MAG: hypothetical protein IKD55_10785 [Sediminibacterium sp.]|nr:hypothetical protein [Sediminibacterium sp.]MBX9779752.1 carboxypeptidase-like regulatory domain-containing protein [Chitinophagaceae bacterium]